MGGSLAPIRVLPDDVVNQIAAGEVIERPASVVRELVENALDAGALRVDVEIDDGGIRRIAVADDGAGMDRDDARLAFRRHATSKITCLADLARSGTLRFRGEAMPSIASVARVRMRTRRPGDALGTELVGEGSGVREERAADCPDGTRIEVADLFGSVPARRKFLKSPVTEAGHVVTTLERAALARPDVRFSLARDGRAALLFLPTADARERAIAVLPPAVGERLVALEADLGSARLRGFVTPTDVARGTTADLHLYVNGRPVRDRYLLHLVGDAYRDALPPGRHPAGVLWLALDPEDVDVNVHPAKQEVRFRDPGSLRRLFSHGFRRALGAQERGRAWASEGAAGSVREPPPGAGFAAASDATAASDFEIFAPGAGATPAFPKGAARPTAFRSLRYLGQALGTYLVLEGPDGLVLLDQHAAHERVLFERLRGDLLAGKLERQALLLPVRVELSRTDAELLLAHAGVLARAGFELEEEEGSLRGGRGVALRALPAPLARAPRANWPLLLEETAAALRDPAARQSVDGLDGAFHAAFATAACHAACRKGDRLEPREVEALLVALDETVWYPNCPHGRPIWLHVDAAELERRFLRR